MSDLTYTDDDGHERCRNCNADWTERDVLRAQVQAVLALIERAEKRMGGDLRSEQAIAALHAMATISGDEIRAALGGETG